MAAARGAPAGRISVSLEEGERSLRLTVEDNGIGLPREGRERLTDPYMTTRAKGTGLGLAIVKKIVEQHGGKLVLSDASGADGMDGARVSVQLPRQVGRQQAQARNGPADGSGRGSGNGPGDRAGEAA